MPTSTRYGDLADGTADLVADLTRGRITADHPCHLDPDLDAATVTRQPGWRGALGQVSAALSHLANNDVTTGDLFLFWGLFRPAARSREGRWTFAGSPEHRIFGWLQVDEVLPVGANPAPFLVRHPWLAAHPHLVGTWPANNTVYLAGEQLALPGLSSALPGWGLLLSGHRLTHDHSARPSVWTLPEWLNPNHGGTGLTYHRPSSWSGPTTLQAAARGQEFIADIGERTDAFTWIRDLLREAI